MGCAGVPGQVRHVAWGHLGLVLSVGNSFKPVRTRQELYRAELGNILRTTMGEICEENILTYNENLDKIKVIHTNLLKGIGWGQEAREKLRDNLDNVTKQNKALLKAMNTKIKVGYAHKFSTDTEEAIRQEKLRSMATLLMESVTTYKNMDIHYKEKSKQNLVNTIRIRDPNLSEEEISDKIERDDIESLLSSSIIQETEEARKQLGEVEDRHKELKKLEEDIMELTELFNDMMELVQDQGEKVNKIEEKMNTTQKHVQGAVSYLQSARELYDKALVKKKMVAMIGAAILLILLIIIISASSSGSNAEPEVVVIVHETNQDVADAVEIEACDPNVDPDCVG